MVRFVAAAIPGIAAELRADVKFEPAERIQGRLRPIRGEQRDTQLARDMPRTNDSRDRHFAWDLA